VADVIEVSCNPAIYETGPTVTVTAAQLFSICHQISWYVPGVKVATLTGPSVTLTLDGEGNANVALIAGPKCQPGESLISLGEKREPFEAATTSFKVLASKGTPQGLLITPASQVEDAQSGSVVTIAQAEFEKGSGHNVRIGAAQLFDRCVLGQHIVYVKENRNKVANKKELAKAIALDGNGNGFVLLIGTHSCAEGPSSIEAELEGPGTMISPLPTFTVEGPKVR
jgi:hypothetical protein